jgi:sialate O-acetylesterase
MIGCSTKDPDIFDLPSIIGDGMVLQQDTEVMFWGRTSSRNQFDISTSWGVRKRVKADKSGNWKVRISTTEAGGPYEMVFQTKDTSLIIKDILMGEVWLGSGQSNMEMPLSGWLPGDTVNNYRNEIAAADYPQIRLFTVPREIAVEPVSDCQSKWEICTPESVKDFSATAYFFGREIHEKTGVPVGIIHSSWGGTPAESWVSAECLEEVPAYAGIEKIIETAETQYDSLLQWMDRLKTVPVEHTEGFYKELAFSKEKYTLRDFDDSAWPFMEIPSDYWKGTELETFDGIVCFRKKFELPASFSGNDMVLYLGPIDDMDDTYLNGVRIGENLSLGFWQKERIYKVPGNLLKSGQNVLTVFVIDHMGGGGIYSSSDISLADPGNGRSLNLGGNWKYMPLAELMNSKLYFFDDTNTFSSRPELSIGISQNTPTLLYNGMINPVVPYTIKGVIWYQGESNVGRGYEYRTLFPALIKCWRNAWEQGEFSFYFVQLAPWNYKESIPSSLAEVREAQLMTMAMKNTGMVVTTDIGDLNTIHPSSKQEVGRRLALWALAKDYGMDTIVCSGPLYDTMEISGNKVIIRFKNAGGKLVAKDGPLQYFEVAGSDQVYYPAMAEITGNTVIVTSARVEEPVAVRFGWRDTAEPNLFNGSGLPASPFRTDNWKRLSE